MSATEAQAEVAIGVLKRMIEAAENGNQAGEDAVVAAAAGLDLLAAVSEVREWIENWAPDFLLDDEWQATEDRMHAAIAKATGA